MTLLYSITYEKGSQRYLMFNTNDDYDHFQGQFLGDWCHIFRVGDTEQEAIFALYIALNNRDIKQTRQPDILDEAVTLSEFRGFNIYTFSKQGRYVAGTLAGKPS